MGMPGGVITLINAAQVIQASYRYDPFGNLP
jgi:hypothetical protein